MSLDELQTAAALAEQVYRRAAADQQFSVKAIGLEASSARADRWRTLRLFGSQTAAVAPFSWSRTLAAIAR